MPVSTPRDVDTILDALDETTSNQDPAIDVRKGPISILYYAVATEMSRTESLAAYLQSVYQLSNADVHEDDDVFQLGLNYGVDANIGKPARVTLTFFREARPLANTTADANAGVLTSSEDGRFIYSTLNGISMDGNFADVYFNEDRQRYEISVEGIAVAVGEDYNLPPNTINRIITQLSDFDGVTNLDYARQGSDPLDKTAFRDLIWDRVQGLNSDIGGSILTAVEDIDPAGFDDIQIVSSNDVELFARFRTMEEKIGYDVYLITDSVRDTTQTFTALGGELFIPLELKPVQAVRFAVVDGVQVPFSFTPGITSDFVGSPLANDGVTLLGSALLPAQTVEIGYTYYDLVNESYNSLQTRTAPFGADMLVRIATPIQILIEGKISTFSTADREDVIQDLFDFTEGFLRNPDFPSTTSRSFVDVLDPFVYQQLAEQSIDGLQEFALTKFVRLDRAFLDVELITLDGFTEYPVLFPEFNIT